MNLVNKTMNALDFRLDDPKQFPSLSKSLHEKSQQKHTYYKIIKHPKKQNNNDNNDNDNNKEDNVVVVCRIDELCDDLLSSILSRIDSWKQLVQRRSVSKRWNIIASQPIFLGLISSKLLPFTLYVKTHWETETSLISKQPFLQSQNPRFDLCDNKDYKLSVVGSYSDLLIYYSYQNHQYIINPFRSIYYYLFFNPITRKHIKLEIPIYYNDGSNCKAIGCAGNLEGISISVVKKAGQQRGFRFVRFMSRYMEVFCFENGKWSTYRKSLEFDLRYMHFISQNSVTHNNKMHWLVYDSIVVIDPFSKCDDITWYRFIKLPCIPCLSTLGVCREREVFRLANFVCHSKFDTNVTLKVWELDYNKSTWFFVCMKMITTTILQLDVHKSLEGL